MIDTGVNEQIHLLALQVLTGIGHIYAQNKTSSRDMVFAPVNIKPVK